ncbi:hypothetical protein ACFVOO_32570 [Streptomyces rochei]|uniref:hypothetical protein n=1 Tax=Streptomyces rochei TaxID=1928 RepID=UPI0036B96B46
MSTPWRSPTNEVPASLPRPRPVTSWRAWTNGAHIEDLQRALAALAPAPDHAAIPRPAHPSPAPAAPSSGPAPGEVGEAEYASGSGRRRRWWSRRV